MLFFFQFVSVADYIDVFPYVEPLLHPWDEVHLMVVDDLFDVFLASVRKNFIKYVCIDIVRELGLKFSFFVGSFCGFGISKIVAS